MPYNHPTTVALVIIGALCHLLVSAVAFELTILHTNDVHARFEQYTSRDGRCHAADEASSAGCFGGLARRATVIKAIRNQTRNVLLLDAGDQYQGTPWFYYYKGSEACHFMNALDYDAMSLGNHEFDNGVEGLLPFLRNITFPVVCSNVRFEQEPEFDGLVQKSIVVQVDGQSIGIVGYLTKETPALSKTGRLEFMDEVESVQAEVDRLISGGITKIIALGHAGFSIDKNIAEQVTGVDVVIGGHTNTFLYTGVPPSTEVAEGPYPLVVTQPGGEKVLVIEGYAFGKYVGHLWLTFDDQGRVVNWTGNPILLDKSISQDPATLKEVREWGSQMQALYSTVVGSAPVYLDGTFATCRLEECTLGNLVTDALVKHYENSGAWPKLRIGLMNGGGIRASISNGSITYEDVLQVMPFGNGIDVVEFKGWALIKVLEHSVTDYSRETRSGRFLQVSGLRITYDLEKPNGNRVEKVEVVCANCRDRSSYVALDNDAIYSVALPSYLVEGGDGYVVIRQVWTKHYNLGDVDADIFIAFLRRYSPVHPVIEGRIQFTDNQTRGGQAMSTKTRVASADRTGCAPAILTSSLTSFTSIILILVIIFIRDRRES